MRIIRTRDAVLKGLAPGIHESVGLDVATRSEGPWDRRGGWLVGERVESLVARRKACVVHLVELECLLDAYDLRSGRRYTSLVDLAAGTLGKLFEDMLREQPDLHRLFWKLTMPGARAMEDAEMEGMTIDPVATGDDGRDTR